MKLNTVGVVIIAAVILLGSVAVVHGSGKNMTKSANSESRENYTAHAPIKIVGNADFAAQAKKEGWPGNGSAGNPYVLSGYEINEIEVGGTGNSWGIDVENTNVHFVIKNCYIAIQGSFHGGSIKLSNVTNAKIEDNTISQSYVGIAIVYKSNNNTVNENTISNCSYAILLASGMGMDWNVQYAPNDNVVSHNKIYSDSGGVSVEYGNRDKITDNDIFNMKDESMGAISIRTKSAPQVVYGAYNVIAGNNIHDIQGNGINIDSGNIGAKTHENIENNNIKNVTGDGIFVSGASENTITGNNISYSKGYAISLNLGSTHNEIYQNILIHNHGSGDTFNSSHVQAWDSGENNTWYNPSTKMGNYWADWANNNASNDKNHDGIVDWPYPIGGNNTYDKYPAKSVPVLKGYSSANTQKNSSGAGSLPVMWLGVGIGIAVVVIVAAIWWIKRKKE